MTTEQIRNKYNTLTPAEAKKLNRILGNRQPLRTASVLRKPRAPPIVVTNLDNELEKQLSQSPTTCNNTYNGCNSLSRQASMRSGSLGRTTTTTASDSRRHTVNYGQEQSQRQGALASRLSLYSTTSNKSSSIAPYHQQVAGVLPQMQQQQQQQQKQPYQISPHESFTNLSLRSCSRDVADCASSRGSGYDPTYRFQTMSVDLGNPIGSRAQQLTTSANRNRAYDTMRGRARYAPQRSNTLNYRFSDDSFASAKSDLSAKSSSVTPTRFEHISSSISTRQLQQPMPASATAKDASKLSLSSSTYKVFQSPFANIKKLFRGIQKPSASSSVSNQRKTSQGPTELLKNCPMSISPTPRLHFEQQQQEHCKRSLTDFSLSDSTISNNQSSLTYSKFDSPPACPPPPPPLKELKSMSYLENSINYSNYDEFTRSRNERLKLTRPNSMNNDGDTTSQLPVAPTYNPPIKQQFVAPSQMLQANSRTNLNGDNQQMLYDTVPKDEHDNGSNWQMTSLPVYYERNLTTVFEETKQASCEMPPACPTASQTLDTATMTAEEIYQSLKPPKSFDDPNGRDEQQKFASEPSEGCECASSVASSNSPALSSAGESVLEFHRQQPATPYRFSFAQPQPHLAQLPLGKSLGLPPRAPPMASASQLLVKNNNEGTSEIRGQDNNSSSSGNSSNSDEQLDELVMADFNRLRPYFLHLLKMIRLEGFEPSAHTIGRIEPKI